MLNIFEQQSASPTQKVILIVDDDANLLVLNRIILEIENFKVYTASSGQDALVLLSKNWQPDLILLDIQMKDMSGSEFLTILEERRPEIFESVPIVFHTARNSVPASRAVGFIRKPIDIVKFVEAIRRFIENSARAHIRCEN